MDIGISALNTEATEIGGASDDGSHAVCRIGRGAMVSTSALAMSHSGADLVSYGLMLLAALLLEGVFALLAFYVGLLIG